MKLVFANQHIYKIITCKHTLRISLPSVTTTPHSIKKKKCLNHKVKYNYASLIGVILHQKVHHQLGNDLQTLKTIKVVVEKNG